MTTRLIAALVVLVSAASAELTGEQKLRASTLQKNLLAPCCWSETVATHRSEVALEMRAEINRLVAEGKSDREILDYYKQRYGMRILVEPEGQRAFWVNLLPPVVLLAGGAWVIWLIQRWVRRRPVSSAG
jgi:cytochrome c-type biogenesis protein CcmH